MKKQISFGNISISDSSPPLIIPEIGINHSGNLEIAFKIVDSAKKAGAHIIKHQTHIPSDEMTNEAKRTIPGNSKRNIYEIISKCSLNEEDEYKLFCYVKKKKMEFISTPFSRAAVDRLIKFGVNAFKIGSGEFNNYPLLDYISKFKKPLLVSTGMSSIKDCNETYKFLKKRKIKFCFLHTTNLYPTPDRLVRLGAITEMKKKFPDLLVGLSDHTIDNYSSYAAVALGAKIIERHFVDVKRKGPDIASSNSEKSLAKLIQGCKKIFLQSGGKKSYLKEEQVTRNFAYASIVADKYIKKGQKFTKSNLWARRPGNGELLAKNYFKILGKVSLRDIQKNEQIKKKDFK